jgi:hypothetical protein
MDKLEDVLIWRGHSSSPLLVAAEQIAGGGPSK